MSAAIHFEKLINKLERAQTVAGAIVVHVRREYNHLKNHSQVKSAKGFLLDLCAAMQLPFWILQRHISGAPFHIYEKKICFCQVLVI